MTGKAIVNGAAPASPNFPHVCQVLHLSVGPLKAPRQMAANIRGRIQGPARSKSWPLIWPLGSIACLSGSLR
eukprot:scaffold266299_cov13-Prasinocladus_malaysianus.AAC.1